MKTMRELINLVESARIDDQTSPPDETYGVSADYQNFKTKDITANQNKINNASRNASNNATLTAHSNHTSPIYSTQSAWDNWIRQGGIEYARQMDLDRTNDPRSKQFKTDADTQQNYVRSQLAPNTNEEYDPADPDSWMDQTNQQNAQYAKTHYSQPADDTLTTDGTYSDSAAFSNYKSRKNSAQKNRVSGADQDANYKADLSAASQHTAPMYSTPEEWNMWVKQGGLDFAQQMDVDKSKQQRGAKSNIDYAEQQAYIRKLNSQNKSHVPPNRSPYGQKNM